MKASTIQVFSSAALSGSSLLIPNLAAGPFQATTEQIGVVVAAYSGALFISSYAFGRYSDVHGRRFILKVGLALSCAAILLQVTAFNTLTLIMVRVLVGLCAGMFPSALLAYVYDTDRKVGKFSAYGSLGFGIGVLAAGFIGMVTVFAGIFLFCAVMMAISFGLSLFMKFEHEPHHHVPLFPVSVIKRNFPIYLSIMFRHVGANMIWVIYPLFLARLGADPLFIGAIYAINAFGQFAFMLVCDRFGSSRLVAVGFIMSIITFPSYTLATVYWEIIPAQITIAIAWSTLYVGSVKYVMERNEEKGTSAGLLQSFLSISAIIGALLGGVAAFLFDFHGCMYIATAMATIGLIAFYLVNRRLAGRVVNDKSVAGA